MLFLLWCWTRLSALPIVVQAAMASVVAIGTVKIVKVTTWWILTTWSNHVCRNYRTKYEATRMAANVSKLLSAIHSVAAYTHVHGESMKYVVKEPAIALQAMYDTISEPPTCTTEHKRGWLNRLAFWVEYQNEIGA
mgnify:CR=1 FL=1